MSGNERRALNTRDAPSRRPSMGTKRIRRILVATNGTSSARDAVELGVELAEGGCAKVTFVHVVPPEESLVSLNAAIRPALERHAGAGDQVLDEAAAVATAHGVPCERALIVGDPGDAIVALADAIDADLIVVGERPRKFRVGSSVSRWVSRHTRRPSLVARPPVGLAA
jgi:nucleotide-binding universal stress UspA family protein